MSRKGTDAAPPPPPAELTPDERLAMVAAYMDRLRAMTVDEISPLRGCEWGRK